jgi:GAF domain-containing protein
MMHGFFHPSPADKPAVYQTLCQQIAALTQDCPLPLPALSNCAALLWEALPEINWAGFYLRRGNTLVLGPFQGRPACIKIPMGKGVCGTAAATRQLQLVPDVHAFPGHIACDSASKSEVVLPLVSDGRLVGVMDIDSPLLSRFDQDDVRGLTMLCAEMMSRTDWKEGLL